MSPPRTAPNANPGSSSRLRFLCFLKPDPGRRMVAGAFFAADRAVDARTVQACRQLWAEQQMVEAKPGVTFEAVTHIVPEGVDALVRVPLAQRIGPALLDETGIGGAAGRLNQRVVVP